MRLKSLLIFLSLTMAIVSMPIVSNAADNAFNTTQKKAIEQIVHDYLVENPQVLVEASQALQKQQHAEMTKRAEVAISKNKDKLFSTSSPIAGNPDGKVTLVEFFDYQCIHCKNMAATVKDLLKKNMDLRVIYKEFPIFGANSRVAARAALAAKAQGKYAVFHNALLNQKQPLNKARVMKIAKEAGVDVQQLQKDMKNPAIEKEIKQNYELAQALGLVGTPAFVVAGDINSDDMKTFFVPGAAPEASLQKMIDQAK